MKLCIIGVVLSLHGIGCFAASPFFNLQSQDLVEALVSSIDLNLNSNEISETVSALNDEIGIKVFNVSNETITLNPSGVCEFLQNNVADLVKQIFQNDPEVQSSVIQAIHQQIQDQIRPDLEDIARASPISFGDISTSRRRKRDLNDVLTELLNSVIKSYLSTFVSSLQTTVDAAFANVTSVISSWYISTNSSNVLSQVAAGIINSVLDVVLNIISYLQSAVNSFIGQFAGSSSDTSTNSTDSRKKRDLNFDSNALEWSQTHLRSKRSISSIMNTIWSWLVSLYSTIAVYLNTYLKSMLVSILSSYYEAVGKFVLLPVRCIADYLINLVLYCSDCSSICS